ncbi:hypothetical protein Pflav_053770 [Phytohabitans flavus]|uniref:Dihydrolipoyllysine-residue acetyltransferase component of pyruvate dehydrogenase complex n=1 Tax=Phytohabitans flavus TaxID=1076124 RepID=A0A6F8XYT2_9ACTN|nr:hypothetical protein Pflav_053770 [Phytohabitans flavus]
MPVSVPMPRLGESVTEGTVTRWLKHEGDRVEVDEPLLEVSTDKVDTEIPSPAAGVLTRIVVQEDETAEVGAELAVISGEDEGAGQAPQEAQPAAQEAQPEPAPQQQEQQPVAQAPCSRPRCGRSPRRGSRSRRPRRPPPRSSSRAARARRPSRVASRARAAAPRS